MDYNYTAHLERAGFRQLQEEIARTTGLSVITTDAHGRALFGKSNPPPFCVLINSTYEGRMACSIFREELARAVLGTGELRRRVCHAGLVNIGVPVDRRAVVIAGGVAVARLKEERLTLLAEEVRCPRERLIELARDVPVWTGKRLAEVAGLIRALTSYAARSLDSRRMLLDVSRLGEDITLEYDEQELVARVVRETAETLGVPVCLLRTYDEEKKALVARGVHGVEGALLEAVEELPVEDSVAGAAFTTGQPVAVPDVRTAGGRMLLPQLAPAVRSALVVPLRARGRALGTLGVYDAAPRVWDEATSGYLTAIAAKVALALENARLYASLKEYYLSALQALAAALEARDTYTRGHSVRVAKLARACARALGLNTEEQEQVYLAALLHDIGKIGVPDSILLKPGRLNPEEWEEVRSHPVVGVRIVEPARFPPAVVAAVRHHHEDYGGGGYPDGLAGEKIPLLARVIRVADAYDAMTSARPYRRAFTPEEALEELRRGAGRQFDPRVVEAFLGIPAAELEETGRGGVL
ncbi:MAG: HD domain-containing phosphohydrolase [Thermodesulfobacteriota bacterium]